jgi:predicted permease
MIAPPSVAVWLLTRRLAAADRDEILGDLQEQFTRQVLDHGAARATWWYWRQALRMAASLSLNAAPRGAERTRWRIEPLRRDFTFAARRLRATPVFTIFAVASLALGVGATTAVYAAVYDLLWKPTDVRDPDRLVVLTQVTGARPRWMSVVRDADLEHLLSLDGSVERLAASSRLPATLTAATIAETLPGEVVTGSYFVTLGVQAARGRTIQPADDEPARASVIVISDRLWRTRLASDQKVVGRIVRLNGRPVEIVGVMSRGFAGLGGALSAQTDVWIPAPALPVTGAGSARMHAVIGRLRADRPVTDAAGDFAAAGQRLDAMMPLTNPGVPAGPPPARRWSAISYADATIDLPNMPVGQIVLTLVGLVLAVACANLANLVLARGTSRRHELAIRRALGASRWRLVREQLAESVVLAGLGALGAYAVVRALLVVLAIELPMGGRQFVQLAPTLNLRAMAAAAVALLGALILVGLVPAFQLTRRELRPFMTSDAGGLDQRWWRGQKRSITWQVAASLGLFLLGLICIRSVVEAARHDSGVDIDHIAVGYLSTPNDWPSDRLLGALEAVVAAVRQQSGVEDAAVSSGLPFGTMTPGVSIVRPDQTLGSGNDYLVAATPGLFRTAGIPIVQGRAFDARDRYDANPVVILSEQTARRLFGTAEVTGREVRFRDWVNRSGPGQQGRVAVVAGVARDTDTSRLFSRSHGTVYVPLAQLIHDPNFRMVLTVVARTPGDPAALIGPMRAAVNLADTDLAIGPGSGSGRIVLASAYVSIGILARLLGSLGVLAVVLSMAGLYGVLSHLTTRRTREMGLRMALGALRRDIVRLVLADGFRPVFEGLLIGLVIVTGVRVVLYYQYGGAVSIVEPVSSTLACFPLILAALLACYLPARRAARIEPTVALRDE